MGAKSRGCGEGLRQGEAGGDEAREREGEAALWGGEGGTWWCISEGAEAGSIPVTP